MTRLWTDGDPLSDVVVDARGDVLAFTWQERAHTVQQILQCWHVDADWWSEQGEVERDYVRLLTFSGLMCELFYDHITNVWRFSRVYD